MYPIGKLIFVVSGGGHIQEGDGYGGKLTSSEVNNSILLLEDAKMMKVIGSYNIPFLNGLSMYTMDYNPNCVNKGYTFSQERFKAEQSKIVKDTRESCYSYRRFLPLYCLDELDSYNEGVMPKLEEGVHEECPCAICFGSILLACTNNEDLYKLVYPEPNDWKMY